MAAGPTNDREPLLLAEDTASGSDGASSGRQETTQPRFREPGPTNQDYEWLSARNIQNVSMLFLTVQQTLNPLLVRKAHRDAEGTGAEFLGSTTVFMTEVIRICVCCIILVYTHGSVGAFIDALRDAFLKNKQETARVCLPALIYVVQNNLYYFALKRVEATLFTITMQLRILTTALLMIVLLKKVFSAVQWGAMCVALIGVALVQLSSHKHPAAESETKYIGIVSVLVMCWTSAFAGVYLEGVLKKSSCDIWLQNIRLSVITLPFSIMTMANDLPVLRDNGIFYGWTGLVWTIAFSSATNGLLVAAVMKYADNIKKSYCQSMALAGTAMLSILMGDSQFSWILLSGVSLVVASVFLYTLYPPSKQAAFTQLRDDIDTEKPSLFESDGEDGDIEDEGELADVELKKREAAVGEII
ncbi:Protein NSTP-8 [Aphelenchoides avenae]|nr:Protein NSTP-8 [Aphelenchus avenae]